MLRPGEWPGRGDENEDGGDSPLVSSLSASGQDRIARSPPVALRGKMDPDGGGYIPENWQWFEILTEPHPLGLTDSRGKVRAVGRDPMTIPLETLRASGHGPREARNAIRALGDEPTDPTIRRLTELRRHCLSCAENAAEVRRCAVIDCPLWAFRMAATPTTPNAAPTPSAGARHERTPRHDTGAVGGV